MSKCQLKEPKLKGWNLGHFEVNGSFAPLTSMSLGFHSKYLHGKKVNGGHKSKQTDTEVSNLAFLTAQHKTILLCVAFPLSFVFQNGNHIITQFSNKEQKLVNQLRGLSKREKKCFPLRFDMR